MTMVASTRYLIVVPVLVLTTMSLASYLYSGYLGLSLVRDMIAGSTDATGNEVGVLKIIDMSLIGTATLVIASDLTVTFLINHARPAPGVQPSRWLGASTVEDLKNRALSMVVLIMVVRFLESVVAPVPGQDILDLGIAVAVVLIAIACYLYVGRSRQPDKPSTNAS